MVKDGNELKSYDLRSSYLNGANFSDGLKTLVGVANYDTTVTSTKLIADVSEGDLMWAKIEYKVGSVFQEQVYCKVEIHVRNVNDVSGGEYQRSTGKSSSEVVTPHVIE
jgi:hypothetical protein